MLVLAAVKALMTGAVATVRVTDVLVTDPYEFVIFTE
jgi:hypothetical protein